MDSKLPLYQWLVALIPGSVFLALLPPFFLLFNISVPIFSISNETIRVFVFLAGALMVGETLQTISSIFEPLLAKSWGGKPSVVLLKNDKYKREKQILKSYFGDDLNNEEVFEKAMTLCNQKSLGRSEYFNILYGYIRSLFTATLLFILGTIILMVVKHNYQIFFWRLLFLELVIAIIFWHRAKKRGFSFVKEIIMQSSLSLIKK